MKGNYKPRFHWVINKPHLDYGLFLILLLIHVDPPLFIFGAYVSSVPLFLVILALFFFRSGKITNNDAIAISVLLFYLVLSNFFTPSMGGITEKIKGSLQLLLGVTAFFLFDKVKIFERARSENTVLVFLILLIFGVFLEIYSSIFREVSDSFRMAVFPIDYLYQSDERDYNISGIIRPKVFSSEPSHVAKTFFILSAMLMSLSARKLATSILCLVFGVGMFSIYQSPILLGIVALAAIKFLGGVVSNKGVIVVSVFAALAVPFILMFSDFSQLDGRFGDFGQRHVISSENIRLYFPFVTAIDVLVNYPFMGVGPSNDVELARISQLGLEYKYLVGNNALARIIIFFGISGLCLFLLLIWYRLRGFCFYNAIYILVFLLLFCFMMGSIETAKFWISIGLVFLCEKFKKSNVHARA